MGFYVFAALVFGVALFIIEAVFDSESEEMKESELSRKVTNFCNKRNAFVFNITGGMRQRPGMPDLLICHNKLPNKSVWLELKVASNSLSDIQRATCRELTKRGQYVFVLRYKAMPNYAESYRLENLEGECLAQRGSIRELWEAMVE